jgi:hypothetical protein
MPNVQVKHEQSRQFEEEACPLPTLYLPLHVSALALNAYINGTLQTPKYIHTHVIARSEEILHVLVLDSNMKISIIMEPR